MSSASFNIVLLLASAASLDALRHDFTDDAALEERRPEKKSAKVADAKAVSGSPHRVAQARDCEDPPDKYKDSGGYPCSSVTEGIKRNPGFFQAYCTYYDDADFTASGMCCGGNQGYGAFWWQTPQTSAPTPSPTASPSSSPTSSPTPSPTASPSSLQAQATGDPHVRNIKGEKFDIVNPGKHVLLQLPRSAQPHAAHLHVVADVEQVSDCLAFYMKSVTVSGNWVASPLEFRAHSGNLTLGGLTTGASLLVGGMPVKSLQEFEDLLPTGLAEVATPKTVEPNSHARKRMLMLAVKLKFPAGPQLVISFMRTRDARVGNHVDHLDVAGIRLGTAKMEVGGLLGEDDHDSATAMPEECIHHMADSLIGGTARHLLEGEAKFEERSVEVHIGDTMFPFGSYGTYE